MLKFAKIERNNKFPRQFFDGQEDQSYGFNPARKLQTGNTRGTQTVGFGGAKIDGANNRIVVTDPASGDTIGMGIIPGTTKEFGFFSLNKAGDLVYKMVDGIEYRYDDDGTLIFKNTGGTLLMYDANNSNNTLQLGKLPDGTTNLAIAKAGQDVTEAF